MPVIIMVVMMVIVIMMVIMPAVWSAGVIMRLLSARIQGRIDGHAPMVGAPRGPGAITLAC